MPVLTQRARASLPDSAFAYIDSAGVRRLPINDAAHVRNALARFDQVHFESDAARERARERLLRAARRFGIVPIGFFGKELRLERETKRGTSTRGWPRGTVTFLLADIEGSTLLLRSLGDGYARVLRDVRRILRDAVRHAKGHEVDARGDEYFAAFHDAQDAVGAAIAIQRGLAEHRWPGDARVCVRIGIHTGRSTLSHGGYVGLAVHTAARICNAGHGEQIVLSSLAVEALSTCRGTFRFKRLGDYELPGLGDPLTLHQLLASGLRSRFPALRTRV